MYRFIVLYIGDDFRQYFSEGLIHVDKTVYVRGSYCEKDQRYEDLYTLKLALRDNEKIRHWHIQMIDVVEVRGANGV